jgi:hypothetical protein
LTLFRHANFRKILFEIRAFSRQHPRSLWISGLEFHTE